MVEILIFRKSLQVSGKGKKKWISWGCDLRFRLRCETMPVNTLRVHGLRRQLYSTVLLQS